MKGEDESKKNALIYFMSCYCAAIGRAYSQLLEEFQPQAKLAAKPDSGWRKPLTNYRTSRIPSPSPFHDLSPSTTSTTTPPHSFTTASTQHQHHRYIHLLRDNLTPLAPRHIAGAQEICPSTRRSRVFPLRLCAYLIITISSQMHAVAR